MSARSYNNLIDFTPSANGNYKFNFTLFGEKRTISVTQDWGEIGSVLWDCEYILCQYLLMPQNVARWRDAVCIELGAGTALAATLLWHCGAISVATDLPDIVQKACLPNLNLALEECSANSSLSSLMKRKHQYAACDLAWGNDEHAEKLDVFLMNKMGVSPLQQQKGGKKGAGAASSKGPASKAAKQAQETAAVTKTQQQQEKPTKNGDDDDDQKDQDDDDGLVIQVSKSERATQSKIDFIIGADMIYHTEQHEPLFRSLMTLMNEKTIFVFVHRKRNEHDTNFIDALKKHFEIIRVTPVAEVVKTFPKPTVNIYEFMLLKK